MVWPSFNCLKVHNTYYIEWHINEFVMNCVSHQKPMPVLMCVFISEHGQNNEWHLKQILFERKVLRATLQKKLINIREILLFVWM